MATNEKSGGVCDECEDNTEGRLCERCIEGFYHDQNKELTDKVKYNFNLFIDLKLSQKLIY